MMYKYRYEHKHPVTCKHLSILYCVECDMTYCTQCGKEWGGKNWTYTTSVVNLSTNGDIGHSHE